MLTWKLEIEYDGTRYSGWQKQPNARTVQGELLKAAEEIFKEKIEIGGSGRTDAGVHALQQVAHLRVKRESNLPSIKQMHVGINSLLPHDINIRDVKPMPAKFHARHDTIARYYLYQISTRRRAFGKTSVWWVRDRLDVKAMSEASSMLIGRHDFRSFSESQPSQTSTLVQVDTAQLALNGDLILFRIGASHFLWKMVRRVVGALVEVGRGNIGAEQFQTLLRRYSNEPAAWTAPPSGLYLERVVYPGEDLAPGPLRPAYYRM
jgi:tRNA pseudouridine38-40 synthase